MVHYNDYNFLSLSLTYIVHNSAPDTRGMIYKGQSPLFTDLYKLNIVHYTER